MKASSYFQRLVTDPFRGMKDDPSIGLERLVRYMFISLRPISIAYLLIALFPENDVAKRRHRDTAVDIMALVQFIVVVVLWLWAPSSSFPVASIITAYLLFCLYLSLVNIVFFSAIPSINKPSTSETRTLLLLVLNVLQVTFSFALFYKLALHLCPGQALFGAFLVLGTVGLPDNAAETHTFLVPLQIAANLLLVVFIVGVFISKVRLRFRKKDDSA